MRNNHKPTKLLSLVRTIPLITTSLFLAAALTCCSSVNVLSVGQVSLSYPDNLKIPDDKYLSLDPYLPEGMTCPSGAMITNDDSSIVISLVEVDDPDSVGIAGLKRYWYEAASTTLSEDESAVIDKKFPGMKNIIENTVIGEPEEVELNGCKSLVCSLTLNETTRMVFCYVEAEGKVIGGTLAIFPVSVYDNDPGYFDEIFSSIKAT